MTSNINDSAYWREFEKNELSHSAAHYLMAIDSLREEMGYARVTDVAEKLEISRGAASMAIGHLKKRGLVTEDPNRFLLLTEDGVSVASSVEHNYLILTKFFVNVLGIPEDVAGADACKMEHLLNPDIAEKMAGLIRFIHVNEERAADLRTFLASREAECTNRPDCPICGGGCLNSPEHTASRDLQSS